MARSKLRDKFFKEKTTFSRKPYNKGRNYCLKLIRENLIKYLSNLNVKTLQTIKTFGKALGKFFK